MFKFFRKPKKTIKLSVIQCGDSHLHSTTITASNARSEKVLEELGRLCRAFHGLKQTKVIVFDGEKEVFSRTVDTL